MDKGYNISKTMIPDILEIDWSGMPEYMTWKQIADKLGCTPQAVRQWGRYWPSERRLPYMLINGNYFVKKSELIDWAKRIQEPGSIRMRGKSTFKGMRVPNNINQIDWRMQPQLLTVSMIKDLFQCSPATVTRWVRKCGLKNKIDSGNRILIDKDDLRHFFQDFTEYGLKEEDNKDGAEI